jgi:GNAT superfamily N-acetyltransferase
MRQQIIAFNAEHFAGLVRVPLGFAYYNDQGELLGGIAGKTFGHWFLLEYLWVAQDARGQGLGRQLLAKAEQEAAQRGCRFVLLDTLDFQAQPFYQALGYQTQWMQADYPLSGSKFFMTKQLLAQGHAEIA